MPVAIVSYADTGAGPAIASRLTDDGFAVTALSTHTKLERSDLGRAVAASCRTTAVDVLVNNTPTFSRGRVTETPSAVFAAALDSGLNAVFSACREAAAAATTRGTPLTIINVVSALGMVGLEACAAEACSAAGVLAATKALAAEWGPTGIRVAAVVAGPTDEWAGTLEALRGVVPLSRFVTSEDIAAAVSFLAGPDAAAIAGPSLIVDGGWLSYGYREDT